MAEGLSRPVFVIGAPDNSAQLFVLEQATGRVQIVKDGAIIGTLVTIPDVSRNADGTPRSEAGLAGMAFHPNFCANRRFYVAYNAEGPTLAGVLTVVEYTVSASDPNVVDPQGRIILQYDRASSAPNPWDHNGGDIGFGPDGYLYIPTGDAHNAVNARILSNNLLGKILRIDVNGDDFPEDASRNYRIPPTNPLQHPAGAAEIWAYGLRNPWRASFDRLTGDYFISDVGEDGYEEVNYEPAGFRGGRDYGWVCMEGPACLYDQEFDGAPCSCDAEHTTAPFLAYPHTGQRLEGCSIIGGYVYRGSAIPELYGRYVYGDFCGGRVWSLGFEHGHVVEQLEHTDELAVGTFRLTSFGQDAQGELYICDRSGAGSGWNGRILKIVRDPELSPVPPPPPITDTDGDGTPDCEDSCPKNPTKTETGFCGCTRDDTDSDVDGVPDCLDQCPNDPGKIAPGQCGCGVSDMDTDEDGVPDCEDFCRTDKDKVAPGDCGCGRPDTDSDGDGTADCRDACPHDAMKTLPDICGCGQPETDSDGDGTPDCQDDCPFDPARADPGVCGCGVQPIDRDGDGTPDCVDACPLDANKTRPGQCGCGEADLDSDGDSVPDCLDACPNGPDESTPGLCGCAVVEHDSDGDGTPDCLDACPSDALKTTPGICGCGSIDADVDGDGDGTPDCVDACPDDALKTAPGICGCGSIDADVDEDGDGTPDCVDGCPLDANKTQPGQCGCGEADWDSDGDSVPDCLDACPNGPDESTPGLCGCAVVEHDSDGDGTPDCLDACPDDALKTAPGICGCGSVDADDDQDDDGTPDCVDGCLLDLLKTAPGPCGCGVADSDGDGDQVADCVDNCPAAFNPDQLDTDGNGVGDLCDPVGEDKSPSGDSATQDAPSDPTPGQNNTSQPNAPALNTLLCRLCGTGCTFTVAMCVPGLFLLRPLCRRRSGRRVV